MPIAKGSHFADFAPHGGAELSVREIAERLGLSHDQARRALNSAIRKLRKSPAAFDAFLELLEARESNRVLPAEDAE